MEIESVRNADLLTIINSLTAPGLLEQMAEDKGCRKILAEALYGLWEVSKRLNT